MSYNALVDVLFAVANSSIGNGDYYTDNSFSTIFSSTASTGNSYPQPYASSSLNLNVVQTTISNTDVLPTFSATLFQTRFAKEFTVETVGGGGGGGDSQFWT